MKYLEKFSHQDKDVISNSQWGNLHNPRVKSQSLCYLLDWHTPYLSMYKYSEEKLSHFINAYLSYKQNKLLSLQFKM